jgi:hypothetical protein
MFTGSINKGISMKGYIERGLVNVNDIPKRHIELANELISRGMNHNSPLPILYPNIDCDKFFEGEVNVTQNIKELKKRCIKCKTKIEGSGK